MSEKFLDGCHKYGWVLSIVLQALMLAYFLGGLNQRVDSVQERVMRIESYLLGREVKP